MEMLVTKFSNGKYNYKGQSKTVTFEELNRSPLTSKGSPNNIKSTTFPLGNVVDFIVYFKNKKSSLFFALK